MRAHVKKSIKKKHCLRTMGILMASVMVLSAGTGSFVFAGENKASSEVTTETEEKMIIYLNGKSGKDSRSGDSEEMAVKSFERAAELAGDYGVIRICGTVSVKGDETWELPSGVSVRRAEGFDGALVKVTGSLVLDNVRINAEDISGDGKVEGAVEKEKVYIPKEIEVDEPVALTEIPLSKCEGDGVFSWEEESFVPSEYETVCKVIFHPYDTDAVDYSKEKGWDEDEKIVVREITVRVASLKEEVTPEGTPETTPEATPEPTQEVTPEPTQQITPEATPEPAPAENVPANTSDSGAQAAPQATPAPETTTPAAPGGTEGTDNASAAEQTPETTPDVSQEPAPEGTPETPENPADQNQPQINLTEEEQAAAAQVQNLIDYFPAEISTPEEVEAVVEASRWYDALSEEQRAFFGEDTYNKLIDAQNKAAVYNRQCNGVTIEGDFPWYVQFRVELNNDKNDVSVLQEKNIDTFISPYDMKLWDLMNDTEYKLNGQQVRITMPAPDSELYTQLVVVHYLEDGCIEYITPIYNNDGTISFATTSFSPYNVAGSKVLVGNTDKIYSGSSSSSKLAGNVSGSSSGKTSGKTPSKTSGKTSSSGKYSGKTTSGSNTGKKSSASTAATWIPRTGDEQPVILYAVIAGVALIILVVIAVAMKKRKK